MEADLLIYNAGQLLTLAGANHSGGPRRGLEMGELGMIPDGAVAIGGGHILGVGPASELRDTVRADRVLDAGGRVVVPGFVDPHTHLVWAGERADEFEMRVAGASYMEIMAAGGGIMSTVRATRAATVEDLVTATWPRLQQMLSHGTTTIEIKTGYGLNTRDELKQLAAIQALQKQTPVTLVPTFMGAHAIPTEYKAEAGANQAPAGDGWRYVDLVVEEMLPAVASLNQPPPFCDVFCEEGAFTLDQSRRVLEAARALGFGLKMHVDEFKALGGTRLAVELGAISADHLVCTPDEEIELLAASDTVAVALPGTPFGLGAIGMAKQAYTPARDIIEAGGAVALATDCNPGTCWCESMQFMIALACRYMGLTPAEALSAATINAAHAVGLGQAVGSLEPGKRADVIVLDIPSYQHLGYRFGTNLVHTVLVGGEVQEQ
jgi:imidazolonepropionase